MGREKLLISSYFTGIMIIIFCFTLLERGSIAQKFFIGMFGIQNILIAKDIAIIIIKSLFFKGASIFDVYNAQRNIFGKISVVFLAVPVLIIGLFFWCLSWEGQTGISFGFGTFIGAVLYDFSFSKIINSRIKVIKNA